jgi:hypothetical protein
MLIHLRCQNRHIASELRLIPTFCKYVLWSAQLAASPCAVQRRYGGHGWPGARYLFWRGGDHGQVEETGQGSTAEVILILGPWALREQYHGDKRTLRSRASNSERSMTSFKTELHLQVSITRAYSWAGWDFRLLLLKMRDFKLPAALFGAARTCTAS